MKNQLRSAGVGRRAVYVGLAAVLTISIAACGGSGSGSGGDATAVAAKCPANPKMETLTIGTQPIAPLASVYLGIDKGFFAAEKIDLKLHEGLQGGAASVAGVISGSDDIGFSDYVGMFQATDKGLPIRAIAPAGGESPDHAKSYIAVMAKKGAGITKPADLAGKTIGVNAVNNVTDVSIKAALEADGVDISKIKFLEIPFPQTVAAVQQNRVAAAYYVEPNITAGLGSGHVPVFYPVADIAPKGSISAYFTSEKTLDSKRCAVQQFVRAMDKSNAYAAEHPDEVRATLPKFTQIPAAVAAKMRLPEYGEPGLEAAQKYAQVLLDQKMIKTKVDLQKVILYPADSSAASSGQ